jgi:methylated-DNA-[protein]-cysteine S-methyltransferase
VVVVSERSWTSVPSPWGPLALAARDGAVVEVRFGPLPAGERRVDACDVLGRAATEISEYAAGTRRTFTVPVAPEGTEFQRRAWEVLRGIPWGETISYAEQARRMGRPTAVRAVGGANGRNPVPILVPCHRVIAADGSLGGFSGGLAHKRALLALEGVATLDRGSVPR